MKILNWIKPLFSKPKPPTINVVAVATPVLKVKQSYRLLKLKPKKEKRLKLPKCIVKNKVSYSELEAKSEASSRTVNKYLKIRAYKCEFCDYWHITHKANKLSFH